MDTETGQVKVVKYVAAVDCGVAINPKLAEGQVEGAVLYVNRGLAASVPFRLGAPPEVTVLTLRSEVGVERGEAA